MNKETQNSPVTAASMLALRRQAEEVARGKVAISAESLDAMSKEAVMQTLHELQVYQIELEMQNDELRRMQLQLELAHARYFDLYDLAPVGYCTLSEKGLVLEANIAAATLLGVVREDLVGRRMSQLIDSSQQDNFYLYQKRLFESGELQSCELKMLKSDDTDLWVKLTTSIAQDGDDNKVQRVVLTDITDAKIMAAALLQHETRYQELLRDLQKK